MSVLEVLERDLGKPVISSVAALTWASLRAVKVGDPIAGYGRLLTL
jgi:maleate cis-trans isomerase